MCREHIKEGLGISWETIFQTSPASSMSAIILFVIPVVYARMEIQLTAHKATGTPCCMDTLLPGVCRALYNKDHERFSKMCRTNPDFSFIQCCNSCHFNPEMFTIPGAPIPLDVYKDDAELMLIKHNPNVCFDRHGAPFCESFVTRTNGWSRSTLTCQHSAFAFRVCRKTCGYCTGTGNKVLTVEYDSATAKNPKKCKKLY